jgi:hypothetical protein
MATALRFVVALAFEHWGLEVVAVERECKNLVFHGGNLTLQT